MKKYTRAIMGLLSIASLASADYASDVTGTSGLINYWRFEETSGATAVDSVGSDAATYNGAVTRGSAGPRAADGLAGMTSGNLAPTYNPTQATISTSADDFLAAGGVSALTVSLWYKLDPAGSDSTRQILFGYQQSTGTRYNFLATRESTGNLKVYLKDAEGDQFHWNIIDPIYNAAATDSTWHNLVFSWDGTQLTAYLDGGNKKIGLLGGVAGNIWAGSESLVMGGDINGSNGLDGQLDEVAVFNTVLNDSAVSSLYRSANPDAVFLSPLGVVCPGNYGGHLQGVATDEQHAIYWSFTLALIKTDAEGNLLKKISVPSHHGDLTVLDGKIYVAVNLGEFNREPGFADSWIYVYDAETLELLSEHSIPDVVHGAGGVGYYDGHFFVVGGLPVGHEVNYVYEYDKEFTFLEEHTINSGYTSLGIQTACYSQGYWWFGCYGNPKILLKTDRSFQLVGQHEFECSLGVSPFSGGLFLIGREFGTVTGQGQVYPARMDPDNGFVFAQNVGGRRYFYANLTGSANGVVSEASLNAGTDVGVWDVLNAGDSYLTNGVLYAGDSTGNYDYHLWTFSDGVEWAELPSIHMEFLAATGTEIDQWNQIVLWSEMGEMLRFRFNSSSSLQRWTGGAWVLVAESSILGSSAFPTVMNKLDIALTASGADIYYNGELKESSIPFLNSGTKLTDMTLEGDTAGLSSAWYDNLRVSIPLAREYSAWAAGWGVEIGSETNDYDIDGLLNVLEYGLGGDPTNEFDQGSLPVFSVVDAGGGSNDFIYVHPQLPADQNSGLIYSLELSTNLVAGIWTNTGYAISGTNLADGTLDFVTNTILIEEERGKYIQLSVECL